jgi:hypothetical protein
MREAGEDGAEAELERCVGLLRVERCVAVGEFA